MTIWTKSMYGVGNGFSNDAGLVGVPIGPGLATQDEWWFRGPGYRALSPMKRTDGTVEVLPAGGSVTFEIACHVAWTSFGVSPTVPGSDLDACPGNTGAYHSGDPAASTIDLNLLSGCALGIADVDDINKVTMDNLAIFSVNHQCVKQKMTTFQIPAKMPPCTGSKCICGWFWLANNGTGNFYMTGFDCKVTNSPADAVPIAKPQDPVFCPNGGCTAGAKRPLYAYNTPSNVPWIDNYNRAGYHASWSFGTDGAQNDIFVKANTTSSTSKSASASSTSKAAVSAASSTSATVPASASKASSSATSASGSAFVSPSAGETPLAAVPAGLVNYALGAQMGASSWIAGSDPTKAVDGVIGGAPANASAEWTTNRETVNAWLALNFGDNWIAFNQIVLYDRPSPTDNIRNCAIMLSSQEIIWLGPLNNDGSATVFNLTTRYTDSLLFGVFEVSPSTTAVGLAEIQLFNNPSAITSASPTSAVPAATSSAAAAVLSTASTSAAASATSIKPSATPSGVAAPISTLTNYAAGTLTGASSWIDGSDPYKVFDGSLSTEWISNGEKANAWLAFNFTKTVTINQLVLYDRLSPTENIRNCAVMFSNSEILPLGPLNNDGSPTFFNFTARQTAGLLFGVYEVSSTTTAAGLAEFQIYNNPNAVVSSGAAASASANIPPASVTSIASALSSAAISGGVVSSTLAASSTRSSASAVSSSVKPSPTSSAIAAPSSTLTNYAAGTLTGASSWIDGSDPYKVFDGLLSTEWITNGETVNAWLGFNFTRTISINQLVLYDRPSPTQNIRNCAVMFSSQEIMWLGPLNNDGSATFFNFTARQTDGLLFGIFEVSSTTTSVGLAEFQIYNNPAAVISGGPASSKVPSASATSVASALSSAAVSAGVASSAAASSAASSTASSVLSSASSSMAVSASSSAALASASASAAASSTSSAAAAPSATLVNFAQKAEVAGSSFVAGFEPAKAVDGLTTTEWVTNGEGVNAWLAFNFGPTPITVNQFVLYDRASASDNIRNCAVMFSSQEIMWLGPLNNDGSPTYFNFTARQTDSLLFGVFEVSSTTTAIGLADFQIYNNPAAVIASPTAAVGAAAQSSMATIASAADAEEAEAEPSEVGGRAEENRIAEFAAGFDLTAQGLFAGVRPEWIQ
ncbi:hypothetical protein Rhopal_002679-T1 [Rhodotorula paludigena]|uniref:DUF7402 domain-containing protein n=1 Tax=Rhodotorula paludigena TaxID=86838 RepID=A0AAV5GKX3_9BASI|nr:hypothetical protein Rhopal_002679-T1 [Rhodotorula paludigena]